jgi:hypothetical protein
LGKSSFELRNCRTEQQHLVPEIEITRVQSGVRAAGNPICGVREACSVQTRAPKSSTKKLKIKQQDYPAGIQIWGSNPAFIWTGKSTEEEGIQFTHTRTGRTCRRSKRRTGPSRSTASGSTPSLVRLYMAQAILHSVKDRLATVMCTSCGEGILSEGETANPQWATFTSAASKASSSANNLPRSSRSILCSDAELAGEVL